MVVVWGQTRENAEKCNSSQIYTRRLNHLRKFFQISFEKKIPKWLIRDISILKLV